MLWATPRNHGAAEPGVGKRGNKSEPRYEDVPKLTDLGIDKRTSAIAQKLATLSDEAFEQVREGTKTIAKALNALKPPKETPPPSEPVSCANCSG